MSNFTFLALHLPTLRADATQAEQIAHTAPRAAAIQCRFVLEAALQWLFARDRSFAPSERLPTGETRAFGTLKRPHDDKLAAMLGEPTFKALLPAGLHAKAVAIQQEGNRAAHRRVPVAARDAVRVVEELFHFLYWLSRTYSPDASKHPVAVFDPERVSPPDRRHPAGPGPEAGRMPAVPGEAELKALEASFEARLRSSAAQLAEQEEALAAAQAELQALRAKNQAIPDPHDYNEAQTRTHLIDRLLEEAGWPVGDRARPGHDIEFKVHGMPTEQSGIGYVDYVLWGEDSRPLAVIEAKRTHHHVTKGQQQAKLYADCLEKQFGVRPVIFLSNGYTHHFWDEHASGPRAVAGFYTRGELALLHARRTAAKATAGIPIHDAIVERPYQHEAIRAVCEHFEAGHRRALVVMATGTGKTRTTVALVDVLNRAERVARVLFLADRRALIRQARRAFKQFLGRVTTVDLLAEPGNDGHVYLSTYPTALSLVDSLDDQGRRRFGPGFFDLIVVDEAHRSVYQTFGDLFRWFDAPLLGLTATPRDEVHRDTYRLFELEKGLPTFAYELATAIADGYLVPPKGRSPQFKFLREGITYAQLSDEEKEEYEEKLYDLETGQLPARIESRALNEWVFNQDTIDKALEWVMTNGLRVDEGTRLGKTILFARNHDHAKLVYERFNAKYPEHKGHFARVIDSHDDYASTLLGEFEKPHAQPTIAISVDMLDTGIDVPEVVNLVFFRAVTSKTKFHQMIGRGTRLCPNLLGPGQDKTKFLVIDLCGNIEFFGEEVKEDQAALPISIVDRVVRRRARLATLLPAGDELRGDLIGHLHGHVAGMDTQRFQVRAKLEAVEKLGERGAWDALDAEGLEGAAAEVGGLPTAAGLDDHIKTRRLDLLILNLQIALLTHHKTFPALQKELRALAAGLLDLAGSLAMVAAQKAWLEKLLADSFWEHCTVYQLEQARLALRAIAKFYEPQGGPPVYLDLEEELLNPEAGEVELPLPAPAFDRERYQKRVEAFLKAHLDHVAVAKLRHVRPLTETDLVALEALLLRPEATGDRENLEKLVQAEPLPIFVRRLVGLDRDAVQGELNRYVGEHTWTAAQLRFLSLLVNYLTRNGVMDPRKLYGPPFSETHPRGIDGLFDQAMGDNIVAFVQRVRAVGEAVVDVEERISGVR